MPRMPIQSASPCTTGATLGTNRALTPAARVREPRREPAGLLAERMRLGHDRELRTHVREQAGERGGRLTARVGQRLRGDGRDDRHRGVEAAPDLLLAPPGEEGGRARVVLAVAAERDQRRLGGGARLLGPPGLHHVEDLDRDVPLAEDRRVGQQALGLALEQLADVGPGRGRGRPSRAAPARCGSCRSRAWRPADSPRRAGRRRGCR